MSTAELFSVLDEIAEAGCLNLLFTGGEPLLREDFSEVYGHAKRNGMLVSIFSNGTLITERIASLFADLPPQSVEISLYGATEVTYEKITRIKGSYRKCLDGIRLLRDADIPVALKTMLMTINRHELAAMENMAKDLGVKFRFDAAIFPRLNGDRYPLSLRVPPEEVAEMEFSDAERCRQWKDFYHRARRGAAGDRLYICGAGINSFHIDAAGILRPCLMVTSLAYPLERGGFSAGWRDVMSLISRKKPGSDYRCNSCLQGPLCGYCPAFFALENGREDICSRYVCEIGAARYRRIGEQ
jgi:MoaA/NifB/PqqE/SkfB family radical SAM enzyme